MLTNPKRAFIEAFLVTAVVFAFGLFIGASFEANRVNDINIYYTQSEISTMDLMTLNDLIDLNGIDCDKILSSSLSFANRIYEEALILDEYEAQAKITKEIEVTHKKYDAMKTLLWTILLRTKDKCETKVPLVVYLYEYKAEDLDKMATQNVWSKILKDLRQEEEIILIPLSGNIDTESLSYLKEKFNITQLPAVIIEDEVIYELNSVEELKKHL